MLVIAFESIFNNGCSHTLTAKAAELALLLQNGIMKMTVSWNRQPTVVAGWRGGHATKSKGRRTRLLFA